MFKNRFFTIVIFIGACVVTSLVICFGGFVVDVFAAYGKNPTEVAPANYPHLSNNLQTDLNTALAPEFPFNFDSAGNPFADKTGVSSEVSAIKPAGNNIAVKPLNGVVTAALPKSSYPNGARIMPNQYAANPNQVNPNMPAPVVNQVDANTLLQERNRDIRQGKQVGDISNIYSVDEVRPIGIIGTGSRNKVWLYAPLTKQTFTVGKGARFRDGTIEDVNTEGVQFKRESGTIANLRWMKNSEKPPLGQDANAPILRTQPTPESYPQSARTEDPTIKQP